VCSRAEAITENPVVKASINVRVTVRAGCEDLGLPVYATPGSAGLDLRAALDREMTMAPGARAAIPTGLSVAIPEGFEAQVRPRSGLAIQKGVTVVNAPGTIDSDYRGEVAVLLVNLGDEAHVIRRGDRIAQMIFAPVTRAVFERVDALPESGRGAGGFGSTGVG